MAPAKDAESSSAEEGEYRPVRDPRDPDEEPPNTDADLGLIIFRSLTIITATSSILCLVVNLVSLIRSFRWRLDIFIALLRVYGAIFAGFVALAETEWQWLFTQWPYLQYWFFRGNLQIFVAVLTMALSGASWEVRFERLMHDIAAWMLLGCGFVYISAGLLCMRQLKHRRVQHKEWRQRAVAELNEMERRKREIQGLLAEGA